MRTKAWLRAALLVVVVYGVARLIDPEARWAAIRMRADRIEHGAVAYFLVLFALAAFPRLPLWAPALVLSLTGLAVEGAQAHPSIVGAAQWGDVVANAIGAIAATLPAWLVRRARGWTGSGPSRG